MPASAYATSSAVTTPFIPEPAITAPEIDEILFPTDIAEHAVGGPMFATIVIVAGNGTEQREAQWDRGRYKFNIAPGLKTPEQAIVLIRFFFNRAGKFRGFRFKDWNDYQATDEPLTPTGQPTIQLVKAYDDGLLSYTREIFKPSTTLFDAVADVTLKRNSSPYSAFTLDETTGIITLTPLITKAISGITQASSAVITVGAAHGFTNGDVVYISGVSGMTQINGQVATVTSNDATHITVNIDSSAFSAWTSGGVVDKYIQPSDTLTWTGEFHIPMRFDIDEQNLINESVGIKNWDSVPIIELLGDSG